MDAIAGLLDGPRARGAFLLRLAFEPPWAVRIQDEAPIAVISVVRGSSLVIADGEEPVRVQAGEVAIARGPRPYVIADDPTTSIQAVVHPGQRCATPDGRELELEWGLGTRTWGNAADGGTIMVTGVYESAGEISTRLLRALPPLLVQKLDSPLVPLLADEIGKDQPGQEAVLDRLLDLLLIAVLRAYFARPQAPGWYRAYADPVVGPAIRMLHDDPAHPWTIQELARRIGVSRAALARRFNELVGEPPMSFLTGWRIALAADLLLEPGATVGSVAPQVGYGSSFALSTAFKRLRGISPQQYRLSLRAT